MKKKRIIIASVIAIVAEKKKIDWGLGNGVLGKVELVVPQDRAAVAVLRKEPEVIKQFIRIDYSEPTHMRLRPTRA